MGIDNTLTFKPVRIAVLHHPVSPIPGTTEIAAWLVNAGQVKDALLEKHFCVVLHGHVHSAWVGQECWPHAWQCESRSLDPRDDSPLMKVCRKAGLRRIGWHVLRHSYASHLVMRGATMMEIKELLGHSTLDMTMRYAHLSPNARRAAVALLDVETSRQYSGNDAGLDS